MTMKFRFRHSLAVFLLALTCVPLLAKPPKQHDLYDAIAANPILTSFASMLQASDLGTFLSSRGPFTVFAPTDSAFAKLPPGALDTLLRPENKDRLQHIVLFHVINNRRLSEKDLKSIKAFFSCEGNPLLFRTLHSGAQLVMKAKIIHADIRCSNGVLHEVDTVLMPPEGALPPIAPPPSPNVTPVTNAPTADTNAPAVTTNSTPVAPGDTNDIPVAPIARPETNSP